MADVDVEIIEQKPVTMAEVNRMLENAKKNKELNFRADKVYKYIAEFTDAKKSDVGKLYEKLKALNISKLRDRHIAKIIDIMPGDVESLKIIFSGESTSLKQDEMKQILEALSENA